MNRILYPLTPLIILFLSLPACDDTVDTCPYKDRTYETGTTFEDGCYRCSCNIDTSVTCEATECSTCTYNEKGYATGDTWPAGDGCNFCTCRADGEFECTMVEC